MKLVFGSLFVRFWSVACPDVGINVGEDSRVGVEVGAGVAHGIRGSGRVESELLKGPDALVLYAWVRHSFSETDVIALTQGAGLGVIRIV